MIFSRMIVLGVLCTMLWGCGGGSSDPVDDTNSSNPPDDGSNTNMPPGDDTGPNMPSDDDTGINMPPDDPPALLPDSAVATYSVTLENYWSLEDFPQGYPDDAHLSLVGGAVHNEAVAFWNPGELASPGIVNMAETGLVDILIQDEVALAVTQGTADSSVSHLVWTDPPTTLGPGQQVFDIKVTQAHSRVTLVTMLGPSPDWFVGVSGQSLKNDAGWLPSLDIDLPLYDGGTRSNITPVMFGLKEEPPKPIALVEYDVATGTYRATETPQIVAKLKFLRIAD